MVKVKITGFAIIKDPMMTKIMQAADVFEKHKVVANMIDINYVIEEKELLSENKMYAILGHKAMLKQFMPNLVFGYIHQIEVDDVVLKNDIMVPYVDNTISVFSAGQKWGLLVDVLKSYKELEYEESDLRKIKSIGFVKNLAKS